MLKQRTKLRSVAKISGGILGDENAISILRINCF